MKRTLLILCILLIFGCNKEEESLYFTATIESIEDKSAIIIPLEGSEILNSGDRVSIIISESYKVGDIIVVEYDGTVREGYPLQINVLSISE